MRGVGGGRSEPKGTVTNGTERRCFVVVSEWGQRRQADACKQWNRWGQARFPPWSSFSRPSPGRDAWGNGFRWFAPSALRIACTDRLFSCLRHADGGSECFVGGPPHRGVADGLNSVPFGTVTRVTWERGNVRAGAFLDLGTVRWARRAWRLSYEPPENPRWSHGG